MHKTRALGSLKDLFPRVHQPLPLDKRESQRLLETIKTSFRKQLDEEHGWSASEPAKSTSRSKLSTVQARTGSVSSPVPARPTDRHMRAILDNPLFGRVELPKPKEDATNSLDVHRAVFQKAVSRGLMNLTSAHGFLVHINRSTGRLREEPAASDHMSLRKQIPDTGAGLLVLQWLRSSGQERDLKFLANIKFTRTLLRFLVAEGLDDVIWIWLKRLMKAGTDELRPEFLAADELLAGLVYAKTAAFELEPAYAAMLKAAALAEETGCSPAILKHAWCKLAFETTSHTDQHAIPPAHIFDAFVALGRTLSISPHYMAHVSLCHPVDPSPAPAVEFLRSNRAYRVGDCQNNPSALRYLSHVHQLAADTAQYLVQTNQAEEASRLFSFVREKIGVFTDLSELDPLGNLEPV